MPKAVTDPFPLTSGWGYGVGVGEQVRTFKGKHARRDAEKYAKQQRYLHTPPPPPEQESPDCNWRQNEDGYWRTDCGEDFSFVDGTPHQNGAVFCMYCGKLLVEHAD